MKPLALLMWLGIVTTAAAQTEHEEMIFRGVGAVTCAEFARQYSVRPDFAELMFLTWAEGYMSARNGLLFTDRKDSLLTCAYIAISTRSAILWMRSMIYRSN